MERAYRELRHLLTAPLLVSFLLFGTMPLWIEAVGLYQYIGLEIMIWVIFALGYNLLLGYAGLPSFGHGAFLGVGAYAFGLTQFNLADNLWVSLLGAVLATTALGGAVALFISHRRGIYYALMTIAFGQIFFFVASKWTTVTGGEDGLLDIRRPPVALGPVSFDITETSSLTWFAFALYAVVVVLLWRLVNAPFGKVLKAIKQNEARCTFLGYNVVFYKWAAFTISCAVAGLAGGLFAMAQQGAYIQIMSLQWSGIIVLMTLIGGGFVSFWGPVLGVILYFVARDIRGADTETWLLWFGLMFMLVVMFKPDGLAGIWQGAVARVRARRRSPAAPRAVPAE
jgi:branched-chain amino acid transport system permease protein